MSHVSRGKLSGRMKYLIVEPRTLIVSRETGSRPLIVILTVLSAVFICGETEAIVPCSIVPGEIVSAECKWRSRG
jgi:hypothetical protein